MPIKTKIIICYMFILLSLSIGCSYSQEIKNDHLVFLGTVEKLDVSSLPYSTLNWVVQCRVDKIVSGEFSGKTFSFRIHSPSKSGLELGKQYRIEATRTSDGFAVDQYQWIK